MALNELSAERIGAFWEVHSCGSDHVARSDWRQFFLDYDAFKQRTEPHVAEEIRGLNVKGLRVLEIGIGQGSEAQQLIQAGARYSGIDLTAESVARVERRCALFGLPHDRLAQMNAEHLDFPDASFDLVFSHGVLHHSPRIAIIVAQIHRVLKPGGRAVVMLYHRHSVNYWISIALIRRFGIFALMLPGVASLVSRLTGEPMDRLMKHVANLKREGWRYLRLKRFIHVATDGPENVYSSVYSRARAAQLFSGFTNVVTTCHHLHERQLPGIRSLLTPRFKAALGRRFGWHLWVVATKAKCSANE